MPGLVGRTGVVGAVGVIPLADYLAVVSMGIFPTPTPTNAERASFAVTFGLRDSL